LPQLLLPFGPFAPLLHQRAKGVDPSPVTTPRRTPELAEECHLEREENDDTLLLAELYRLAEGCGRRLRQMMKETAKLKLTVHFADGVSSTRSKALTPSSSDDRILFDNARHLYDLACERRVRVKSLRLLCEKISEPQRQMEMLDSPAASTNNEKLQGALDEVRNRYGTSSVKWGNTMAADPRSKVQNPKRIVVDADI
jgi:DNA polymerase-4